MTTVIKGLEARLGNKSITVRKTCNENINGNGKDSRSGIDSSSHGKDGKSSKSASKDSSEIKVTEKESCIDVEGKEIFFRRSQKENRKHFYRQRLETLQVHPN